MRIGYKTALDTKQCILRSYWSSDFKIIIYFILGWDVFWVGSCLSKGHEEVIISVGGVYKAHIPGKN